jgi:NADPH:quinone reductase-like Zn-dependent oxidoreductase/acyl carrier protein
VHRLDARHGIAELISCAPGRGAPDWLLDPALLDGSLQALLVLVADHAPAAEQGAVLPWRFGRVRLLRLDGGQPCRADLHVRHVGPRSVCADIALLDAAGAVVAELLDCWFVAVQSGRVAADRTFWTAYVPSLRQIADDVPPAESPLLDAVLAAVRGTEDEPASVLLADACASAMAFEALAAQAEPESGVLPPELSASPLAAEVLGWLAEDGLATQTLGAWRLPAESDLPPASDIWRSLFFDTPRAAAECALLAAIGGALGPDGAAALRLSETLRTQVLFGSPSGNAARAALLDALDAILARWPDGRCIRVAVTGALDATLLRQIAERVAGGGIPLRLLALAQEAASLGAAQEALAPIPGAAAKTSADAERNGFDLVLNLFGLSLPGEAAIAPASLVDLLAPGGTLLAAEPAPGRLASLVFGRAVASQAVAALRAPDAWCATLREEGCAAARAVALDGALWPVALIAAAAPPAALEAAPTAAESGLVVFAAPDDPLAEALAARRAPLRRLPVEALKDALAAPFAAQLDHLLMLAPGVLEGGSEADHLAELLADIGAAMLRVPGPAPRLWLVAHGAPTETSLPAALTGLRRVAANELPGLDCRTVCLDDTLAPEAAAGRLLAELAAPDAEREVWWTSGGRLVPRLRRHLPAPAAVSGPRRLEATRPGLIGSLAWLPLALRAPGAGEVAVAVRAAALNFRDVMWAQGLLPDEALLEGFSGPSLGLECAGVVTAVGPGVDDLAPGDRVIAVAPASLATEVVTPRLGVMRMPPSMDFAEAATIPVAFMTVVYALGHLARLQPGERVLIHGGAGGVGLAAIQYALDRGAEVHATAGSEMRRRMLRELGVAGVYGSRSARFADEVLAATGGEGVDVVLNSLSGELMRASLRLLRPFGRFLEIGKRDLYANTAVGIRPLRHNAAYFAIDSDELVGLRPSVGQAVLDEITGLLEHGRLRPLPYRAFGFAEAVDAFRLMQSSGHIGKLVLLPEPTPPAPAAADFAADPACVYVVTGGLAGFGLQAARWLVRQGARRLALIGRRGRATPGAAEALAEFAGQGVQAEAFACDISDDVALGAVLAHVRGGIGPIRGVLHAAMVLDDALLPDLDAARFAAVIRPKLAGAAALDRLTRGDALDLFVLFSSVTTVIGTPGQANYVAANAAVEALAGRRRAAGLPALAVQFGPIGDAGYLVRESRVGDMLAGMLGAAPLTAAEALDALPFLLASGRPVAGLADAAWGELRGRLPGLAGTFWDEMPAGARAGASGQSVRARLAALPAEEAAGEMLELLREELGAILKQNPQALDINRPVLDFGVDSLMAVELRTALEVRLGVPLPLMALGGGFTLRTMGGRLVQALLQGEEAGARDTTAAAILRHEGADALAEAGQ